MVFSKFCQHLFISSISKDPFPLRGSSKEILQSNYAVDGNKLQKLDRSIWWAYYCVSVYAFCQHLAVFSSQLGVPKLKAFL